MSLSLDTTRSKLARGNDACSLSSIVNCNAS
jgi:hypothetical protein